MAQRSVKEEIVEAGGRVFLEKGFHAASVNDLVADAGVPKGSFYNHFESKDALALEVAMRYVATYEIEKLLDKGKPPLARLRANFEAMVERIAARGIAKGCLLGTFASDFTTPDTEVRTFVASSFAAWGAAVGDCLAEAQEAGDLGPEIDPRALGQYLVDAYEGAILHAKVSRRRAPLDNFLTTTFDMLLPSPRKKKR